MSDSESVPPNTDLLHFGLLCADLWMRSGYGENVKGTSFNATDAGFIVLIIECRVDLYDIYDFCRMLSDFVVVLTVECQDHSFYVLLHAAVSFVVWTSKCRVNFQYY